MPHVQGHSSTTSGLFIDKHQQGFVLPRLPTATNFHHSVTDPNMKINKSQRTSSQPIKCLQINLQHAKAATAQATQFAVENAIDIIFAQEPYTRNGMTMGFPMHWNIYQKVDINHPPRAIIICCNTDWSPSVITMERDSSAILLDLRSLTVVLVSQYSPPSEDLNPVTQSIQNLLQRIHISNMVFAGDYNAHNTTWGYAVTSPKGRDLEDFLSSNNFVLQNTEGAPPSYDRIYAHGWPDLTFTTTHATNLIQDWKVEDAISLSDHKFITFTLDKITSVPIIKRYKLPGQKITFLHQ
ncbi:uncharacterized protein LOC118181574 [Stegodyphus dumicola]|uniref:uncharacterized protein LOC118181574 n=1 Tax=Stegodyphus dumicola TaxID=202533 RepID=UPI0015AF8BC8|nr:uncharacterized protein LOC118181574 [Stegodyphus dumicola]